MGNKNLVVFLFLATAQVSQGNDLVKDCKEAISPSVSKPARVYCERACDEDAAVFSRKNKDFDKIDIVVAQMKFSEGIESVGFSTDLEVGFNCSTSRFFLEYVAPITSHELQEKTKKENTIFSELRGRKNLELSIIMEDKQDYLLVGAKGLVTLGDVRSMFASEVEDDESVELELEALSNQNSDNLDLKVDGRSLIDTDLRIKFGFLGKPDREEGRPYSTMELDIVSPFEASTAHFDEVFGLPVLASDALFTGKSPVEVIRDLIASEVEGEMVATSEVVRVRHSFTDKGAYVSTEELARQKLK